MRDKIQTAVSDLDTNVGVSERGLSLLSGSLLMYSALKRGKPLRGLMAGYLLFRGASGHCPGYKAIGRDTSEFKSRNINIKTVVSINKPRAEVYEFWRKPENLPLFMKHLESVNEQSDRTSEWKVRIPKGLGHISWKSEIVEDQPTERIGWRSLAGSPIENAGNVHFEDAGKFGTNVHVVISYRAPAGEAGERLGKLLNPAFEELVKNDVRNLKRYLEAGELPTIEGQPHG